MLDFVFIGANIPLTILVLQFVKFLYRKSFTCSFAYWHFFVLRNVRGKRGSLCCVINVWTLKTFTATPIGSAQFLWVE